ncbi:MAG: T9SS type A sorting domain-containing protein [Bacteroidia bacterium]
MKKIFTTVITLLIAAAFAQAQTSGGPDTYGYIWRNNSDPQGPTYSWIDISGLPGVITVTGLGDDNITGPYALTIPFHYYWYDPATFWIGPNGHIGFSSATIASPFPIIPSPVGIQNYLAGFSADLTFTDINQAPIPGVTCQYWQSNDTLIVSWNSVPFWDQASPGYSGSNSFQVILSTIDSSITYQYQSQSGVSFGAANFLTIGIENNSGNIGLQYLYDMYPASNTSVKFYYPDTVTLSISDASTSYTGNPGSRGIFRSRNGAAYVSQAEVANTGNQPLAPFNSYSRVVNATNIIQVRDTVLSNPLTPGQSQAISYPDTWVPTVAGTFRHINVTLLAGDATPSNNQRDLEIRVVDTTLTDIPINFDNTTSSTNGISWAGGGGGIGMHFTPPFYPCTITKVGALVDADANNFGFSLQVYADDGPNGAPLTQLDSFFVQPGTFTLGTYYETNTTQNILINSGGFYVAWMMGGDGVLLAEDGLPPYSFQSYEVLGLASNPNSWAEYRNAEVSDPIIHAVISTTVGINENTVSSLDKFSEFYPNPAMYKCALNYTLNEKADLGFKVLDIQGKVVAQKELGSQPAGDGVLELNLRNLEAGVYICKIIAGNHEVHKKITVIR